MYHPIEGAVLRVGRLNLLAKIKLIRQLVSCKIKINLGGIIMEDKNNGIRVVKILSLSEKMNWPYNVAEIVHDKNEKNKQKFS